MSNELYIYTTPAEAEASIALDSGLTIAGQGPITVNGRSDAQRLELPADTPGQGAALTVAAAGYDTFGPHRGLIVPSAIGEAKFQLDNVALTPAAITPAPGPDPLPPAPSNDPAAIIQEIYATGAFNLATQKGCGEFTEACCTELHTRNNMMWGHIKKNPGQNQWNGHAVDAVQCLAGEFTGAWDIIQNSVSYEATPAFNNVGPADPLLWYYPIDANEALELRVVRAAEPEIDRPTPRRK